MSKVPPPVKPKPKIPPPITSKKPPLSASSSSSPSSFGTSTVVAESSKVPIYNPNCEDINAIGPLRDQLRKVSPDLPGLKQVNQEHYDSRVKSNASTAKLQRTLPNKNASLFNVPITMSVADFSGDENDENDENDIEAKIHQPSFKPSVLNYESNSFSTKTVSAFPPPPKHRSTSNARREGSEELEEREKADEKPPALPLRRNEQLFDKPTSPLKNIPPPPRHRSLSNLKQKQEAEEEQQRRKIYEENEIPPSLPARHSVQKNLANITLDSKNPSEFSTRETSPKMESSRNHIYDNENDGEYEEQLEGYGRRSKNRSRSRSKHSFSHHGPSYSNKSGHAESLYSSDEYDSDKSDNGKSSLRRDSSALLSSAKVLSKNGYHSAKEKSGPLARHAMGGLSKMKNRLKNSGSSLNLSRAREEDEQEEEADNDEEYESDKRNECDTKNNRRRNEEGRFEDYEHNRRKYTPERPSRLSGMNRSETPETPERSARSERPKKLPESTRSSISSTKDEAYVEEDSIDEDRPPLPIRKTAGGHYNMGTPLPGLSGIKPQPAVSSKPKPVVPPKKKDIEQTAEREIFLKQDVQIRNVAPPKAPPSRSGPPPPPPTRSRPQVPPPRSIRSSSNFGSITWKEPDLDLELPTCWFIKNDSLSLPSCFKGLDYQSSFGYVGKKQFKIYAFRWKDLSTIRLKLVWLKDSGSPLDTLTHDIKVIPPPPVTKSLLLDGHEKYGEHVANWCEVKEGSKVGNGECWTLAHDALEKGCGKYAFVSSGLNHGALITTFRGINADSLPTVIKPDVSDEIRRGDILQFKSCFFKYPNETQTFGSPDHTAIVLNSSPSDDDKKFLKLTIIQQNFNGHKIVSVSEIEIDKLAGGELKVYRPVDADWISDLSEVVI